MHHARFENFQFFFFYFKQNLKQYNLIETKRAEFKFLNTKIKAKLRIY